MECLHPVLNCLQSICPVRADSEAAIKMGEATMGWLRGGDQVQAALVQPIVKGGCAGRMRWLAGLAQPGNHMHPAAMTFVNNPAKMIRLDGCSFVVQHPKSAEP